VDADADADQHRKGVSAVIRMGMIQEGQQSVLQTTTFLGYNHNDIIGDGEMYDMLNLSGDRYPLLSERKKRGITTYESTGRNYKLAGIRGGYRLTLVIGPEVYYGGYRVAGLTVSEAENMCPKKIVSMGAYVCIWPDKVYFNSIDPTDCGSMERLWSGSGEDVSLNMCRVDGTGYNMDAITISTAMPADPQNGDLWIDQSGDNDVLRQYASATLEWVEVASTFAKISATGIGTGIRVDDVVQISGLKAGEDKTDKEKAQVEALNGSKMVYARGDDYIVVVGLLSVTHTELATQTVRADRSVPDLDWICESNNRLWGCWYGGHGGKFVNEIRACKLGDFRNWDVYAGTSMDSWTGSVGVTGEWTGAIAQRGYPVFFKENAIIRVTGTMPSNYGITTTICRGVQEGSGQSLAVVNEAILYKSRTEVMVYDGSTPQSVSRQLGGIRYKNARAGAIGGKYYISMQDQAGQWFLFCYDTEKGLWYREDGFKALMFAAVGDEIYAINEQDNTLVAMLGSDGVLEEEIEWRAEFGLFGTDYRQQKYLSRFDIRMYIEPGTVMTLWIMYDSSGEWEKQGEIRGRKTGSFVLPVAPRRCDHLRFRLTGEGEVRIYNISRILGVGGDAT